jgi:hypothetical protein
MLQIVIFADLAASYRPPDEEEANEPGSNNAPGNEEDCAV